MNWKTFLLLPLTALAAACVGDRPEPTRVADQQALDRFLEERLASTAPAPTPTPRAEKIAKLDKTATVLTKAPLERSDAIVAGVIGNLR